MLAAILRRGPHTIRTSIASCQTRSKIRVRPLRLRQRGSPGDPPAWSRRVCVHEPSARPAPGAPLPAPCAQPHMPWPPALVAVGGCPQRGHRATRPFAQAAAKFRTVKCCSCGTNRKAAVRQRVSEVALYGDRSPPAIDPLHRPRPRTAHGRGQDPSRFTKAPQGDEVDGAAGLTVADSLACGWSPPHITHGEAQAPGRAPREHPVRALSWYEA